MAPFGIVDAHGSWYLRCRCSRFTHSWSARGSSQTGCHECISNALFLTIAVALTAARGAWRGATRAPPAHRRRAAAPRLGWMEDAAALQAAKGRASKELALVAWLEENGRT